MLRQFAGIEDKADSLHLEAAYSSYDFLSGWNAGWGLMKDVELITNKGGVYLFSTTRPDIWIDKLGELEEKGVGDRTCEGFGQIQICSDFHLVFRRGSSMSESLDPQKQLKIQKGIRRAEDKLVTDIQTALEDTTLTVI
jgi:CRISPR-associated protein Csx10